MANLQDSKNKKRQFVTLLTFCRAPLILLAAVSALCHSYRPDQIKLVAVILLMALSALTDLFDGLLARRWEVVSRFGALADPLMDKIFYVATLPVAIFLAARLGDWQHAALLLALDVISMVRDQWVSFLRSIGTIYGADVRANWSGKLRTALGFPVIVAAYLFLGLMALEVEIPQGWRWLVLGAEVLLAGITLLSAGIYTRDYWPHLLHSLND